MRRCVTLSCCIALCQAASLAVDTSAGKIRVEAGQSAPVTIHKVPVTDCRVVRGFLGTPVDGSVHSWDYRGLVREYPDSASDGVVYAYLKNDGLHISLADGESFNVVILRGGAAARMYVDVEGLTEPSGREPVSRFQGGREVETVCLAQPVGARRVSFFGIEGGSVADVAFYRVDTGHDAASGGRVVELRPGPPSVETHDSISLPAIKERYGDRHHLVAPLVREANAASRLSLEKGRPIHLISEALDLDAGLAAVELAATLSGPCSLTVTVQDPLNPRLDLTWVELAVEAPGALQLRLDVPDQVLLDGSRLWLTVRSDRDLELATPQIRLHVVSREQALPEAITWRKLLMRSYFSLMSEPRPWGAYGRQSREEFYASSRYAAQCPELFLTIDQCHALGPADDTVRQYREWVYLRKLEKLSEVEPPPEPPAGVPAWAWYPRLAWLEVRRIAEWWLDERLAPTGEFGGRVGDDTDFYQQFTDLPFFEDTGVAARMVENGAKLAELADRQNLREGLNLHATDSLHAYEEGINHLALMARWFYGDPIYFERCMESARNMEALTIVTEDGRRHFRDKERMGFADVRTPRPPKVDGGANPLMWHTALQVADYNRNPQTLKVLQEWADTWLRFMKPGQWATEIEVLSRKVVGSQPSRPLYGGYRTQGVSFVWLYGLTGHDRYIEPFMHYYRQNNAPLPADTFLGDVYCLGAIDSLGQATLARLTQYNPALALYVKNDPSPLIQTMIGSPRPSGQSIDTLYDARRWPDMFTSTHQFTDRVFPNLLEHASVAYLGGYCRRNKYNPGPAVSWQGFGTDYAALVLRNRPDSVKAAVYSFASRPMAGAMRLWGLAHGSYRVTIGADADGDFKADTVRSDRSIELAKGDSIDLTIQPNAVTVIEIEQKRKLDPIYSRADLAIAARELQLHNGTLSGVVHNLGSADVDEVVIAVADASGRTIARKSLGPLAAPVDLVPKRVSFGLSIPGRPQTGWTAVVDPENRVPEICEGNNRADMSSTGAAFRKLPGSEIASSLRSSQ